MITDTLEIQFHLLYMSYQLYTTILRMFLDHLE